MKKPRNELLSISMMHAAGNERTKILVRRQHDSKKEYSPGDQSLNRLIHWMEGRLSTSGMSVSRYHICIVFHK